MEEATGQEEYLFEKPKGGRRYLGKPHHKGKDHMFNILRTEKHLEKTVEGQVKNQESSDNFEPDVKYSLNKKQRWELAENPVEMLKMAPESMEVHVVEKNIMREDAGTFAVHSKIRNGEDPDDFDVRSCFTSGSGQDFSNFLPESRELSEKKRGSKNKLNNVEEPEIKPTVIYNIYRAHKSKEMIELSAPKGRKPRKARKNENLMNEIVYSEEESEYSESDEKTEEVREHLEYSLCLDEEKKTKQKKTKIQQTSESSTSDFEIIPREFPEVSDFSQYLRDHPYTLITLPIHFTKISTKNLQLQSEVKDLLEKNVVVETITENDIIVDISKWINPYVKVQGQSELLVGISHFNRRICTFIISSTIDVRESSESIRSKITSSVNLYEALRSISEIVLSNRIRVENAKIIEEGLIVDDLYKKEEETIPNCEFTRENGTPIDWSFICSMVHSPNQNFEFSTCGMCDICNQQSYSGLYSSTCSNCLSSRFFHEFSSHNIPSQIPYNVLQRIIPLPILNLYTTQLFEEFQPAEKCPNCMTLLTFSEEKKWDDHKCGNCGTNYCSKCRIQKPHWPMKCSEFEEWNKKWEARLEFENAQGNGTETLLKMVCQCRKGIITVKMPCEGIDHIICPACKIWISLEKMKIIYKKCYYPWSARCRKRWQSNPDWRENIRFARDFQPHSTLSIPIKEIPIFPKNVIENCRNGRNIGKNNGYLIEMITAWMYMQKGNKENEEEFKKIRKIVENLQNENNYDLLIQKVNSISK
ncbi:unnamed protein product [Caenorhabditis angaria]|uniref:Uncharacterized protein n=1 Tax=Caenorhabditis angaria TaxID=860376 RepID=A0A9P1IWB8_9PELO|nr:unnamed protein product [Caenorhabditis angaria]